MLPLLGRAGHSCPGAMMIIMMILILPLIRVMQPPRSMSGWRPGFGVAREIEDCILHVPTAVRPWGDVTEVGISAGCC